MNAFQIENFQDEEDQTSIFVRLGGGFARTLAETILASYVRNPAVLMFAKKMEKSNFPPLADDEGGAFHVEAVLIRLDCDFVVALSGHLLSNPCDNPAVCAFAHQILNEVDTDDTSWSEVA